MEKLSVLHNYEWKLLILNQRTLIKVHSEN